MAMTTYAPGSWLGMLGRQMALLAPLDPGSAVAGQCWELIDRGAGIDLVLDALAQSGLRNAPQFALVRWADGRLQIAVRGEAVATTPEEKITAEDVTTWVERSLDTIPRTVVLSGGSDSGAGPSLSVNGGIVLAGSLMIALSEPAAAQAPVPVPVAESPAATPEPDPPEPAGEVAPASASAGPAAWDSGWPDGGAAPEPPGDYAPVPRGDDEAEVAADEEPEGMTINRSALGGEFDAGAHDVPAMEGPMVAAVACPHGHLNPPYGVQCRVCGAQIPPQEAHVAPRPVLGILRLSTGDIVPLDRGVVMGRNPRVEDGPQRPHVVRLPSPTNDISRSHVEVGIDEWHVVITDLNSTNGTTVTAPGQQPVRLRPHEAMPIEANTEVNLADEVVFRFEVTE